MLSARVLALEGFYTESGVIWLLVIRFVIYNLTFRLVVMDHSGQNSFIFNKSW